MSTNPQRARETSRSMTSSPAHLDQNGRGLQPARMSSRQLTGRLRRGRTTHRESQFGLPAWASRRADSEEPLTAEHLSSAFGPTTKGGVASVCSAALASARPAGAKPGAATVTAIGQQTGRTASHEYQLTEKRRRLHSPNLTSTKSDPERNMMTVTHRSDNFSLSDLEGPGRTTWESPPEQGVTRK